MQPKRERIDVTAGSTILVVDDTEPVRDTLARILRKSDYQVVTAGSGEIALSLVVKSPPDLVLLDIRLDGIDGLAVCRQLKEMSATRAIPVILLSGYADVDDWVEGLRIGAADYITKPFRTEELLTRVKTHLTLRRASQSLEQQALALRRLNEHLQIEIQQRKSVELELRLSLSDAERARSAMHVALEDHKLATDALRQSEEKYRCLFESSSDAMMTVDSSKLRFTSANASTLKLLRAPDLQTFLQCGPKDISPEKQPDGRLSERAIGIWQKHVASVGQASFDWVCRRFDGDEFPASISLSSVDLGGVSVVQATIRDTSVQKRDEAEFLHNHKLEAVGQLASGIAHEINTPAQFVGDGLSFLKDAFAGFQQVLSHYQQATQPSTETFEIQSFRCGIDAVKQDVDYDYLNENVPSTIERCIDGVGRIATIVRAMKEFAHPDQQEKVAADLNQALRNALAMSKNEYKYVADIETDFGELCPVTCHVGELIQVFLNLIVNAAHAIADAVATSHKRGMIRLCTRLQGDWVQIEIADSGAGVPSAIQQRIFDPFFTTKEVGRGSGQGLAIARAIVVTKHYGTLTFASKLGQGTTFTIRLPVEGAPIALSRARGFNALEPL